jgi:SSS family solute:Na+ symporter
MLFISFLFFTALVAFITYLKTRHDSLATNDDYFLGGRSLTFGIIAGSLMLTNLSPVNFAGMSAQAYTHNMSVMGWEVGSGIALVLVALILVPRYLRAGLTTIPEFLENRFDKGVKNFVTYLFLIGYVLNGLPITLYAGSVVLSQLFDIPGILHISYAQGIWVTVWAIGIIGSIYAIFGGLKAVAYSDMLNGFGLIVGGLTIPFLGFKLVGGGNVLRGIAEVVQSHPEKFNAVGSATDPVPFTTLFTGMILVNLYYWGTDQGIIQRALGARDLKQGQKGVMLAGLLKIFTPFIVIIPGIIAFHLYGSGIGTADLVYSKLVKNILPTYFVGFFAAVMFGAILSTFNSLLNSSTTLFSMNIWKPLFHGKKTDHEIIKSGRYFGLVIAVISMIIAPLIMKAPQGLFQYLQIVNGFFNVPIFTIIFIGYATKKVPAIAAKISLTVFVGTYALMQLVIKPEMHFLHQLAILFVVCSLLMLVIGWFKPMATPYVPKFSNQVNVTPWKYQYEAAVFVVSVMFSFYVTFSKLGVAGGTLAGYTKIMLALWTCTGILMLVINRCKSKAAAIVSKPADEALIIPATAVELD